MEPYAPEIETAMKYFYNSLNEKERRRYAGLEALKLGLGGRNYIARTLKCSRRTVTKGAREVSGLSGKETELRICEADRRRKRNAGRESARAEAVRIRGIGGGRKPYTHHWKEIDEKFLLVLREHTAGDPMDATVRWTDLTPGEMRIALREDHGIRVSKGVVRQLLKKHNYRRRQAQKKCTLKKNIPNRNEQFENIARLTAEYRAAGNPILSMDTKKKEHLGNFYRAGHLYTLETLLTNDHDFISSATGVIIPHSLYDEEQNIGYIQIGTSHDTSDFVCDSLRHWWYTYGQPHFPQATSLLIKCDGGGSNDARHYLFKQDLQILADEIGIEIRIAHYPPYCSKYNPIEHRLFPHVTRACQGVVFASIELVKELMEKTHTQTGLKTFVHIIDHVYQTGRTVAKEFKKTMRIVFDEVLPQWNYRAVPLSLSSGKVI